jgi:hypothetical protein
MDRVLFGDEPWILLYLLFIASWFLTLNFTFFRGIAQRLPLCMQLGQPFCNVPKVVGNPLAKFVTGGRRVLVTLWQICNSVLNGLGNPLTNSSQGTGNFCK